MSLENIIETVSTELSGERAKKYALKISTYHRIQGSSSFLETVEFIKSELELLGDRNYKIDKFDANGKKNNYTWYSPFSWDIKTGYLQMIEPKIQYLCRFEETPESIATHSKSTDTIAELVDIKDGKDDSILTKEKIQGKIVLTTASIRDIKERLFELGALGAVFYPTEERSAGYDNLIQYIGLWPNEKDIEKTTFGFSISRKQAIMLKEMLNNGKKVILRAVIDAKLYAGKMHVLSTTIEGREKKEEEILLIAHLCHPYPSANDNASGSGLLLEIFRTLKALVENKTITPERTIRFLWVPEFNGTIPWIKQKKVEKNWKPIFCINLDMVGEHPAIVGEPFTVNQSSISTPSFLDDLIAHVIEKCKDNKLLIEQSGWRHPWNYRIKPFAGGSDHVLFTDEPVRVPSVMFGHSDKFWHTNLDTIEKVDSTELKRVGVVTAVTVLSSLNRFNYGDEILLAYFTGYQQRKSKILQLLQKELSFLENKQIDKTKTQIIKELCEMFIKKENERIASIQTFFANLNESIRVFIENDLKNTQEEFIKIIENINKPEFSSNVEDTYLSKRVIRKWNGPFNIQSIRTLLSGVKELEISISEKEEKAIKEFLQSSYFGGSFLEIINLINNKRRVREILVEHTLAFSQVPNFTAVKAIFKYLKEKELIELI